MRLIECGLPGAARDDEETRFGWFIIWKLIV